MAQPKVGMGHHVHLLEQWGPKPGKPEKLMQHCNQQNVHRVQALGVKRKGKGVVYRDPFIGGDQAQYFVAGVHWHRGIQPVERLQRTARAQGHPPDKAKLRDAGLIHDLGSDSGTMIA